jgi:S-methylmethionine-dependent homocysteine/selenocysteine methylase
MNRRAVSVLEQVRAEHSDVRIVINGVIGPRGDGYVVSDLMTAEEAERYHEPQIATLSETAADMITGLTINYADEAIGIVRAASGAEMPVSVSFTNTWRSATDCEISTSSAGAAEPTTGTWRDLSPPRLTARAP